MKISKLFFILTRAFNFLPLINTFYAFYVLIARLMSKRLCVNVLQYSNTV